MLALGGRRGDVSYDISHGWVEFDDPGLQLRYCGAPAAMAPLPEEPPPQIVPPEAPPEAPVAMDVSS